MMKMGMMVGLGVGGLRGRGCHGDSSVPIFRGSLNLNDILERKDEDEEHLNGRPGRRSTSRAVGILKHHLLEVNYDFWSGTRAYDMLLAILVI
jgi:hypothetical protein